MRLSSATLEKVAAQFDALLFGTPDAQRRYAEIGVAWLDSDDAKIEEELANSGFPRTEIARRCRDLGVLSAGGELSAPG